MSIASRNEFVDRRRRQAHRRRDRSPRRCRRRWTCGRPSRSPPGTRRPMEKFGGVDLLFVNSGGPPAGPALSFDDDAWKGGVRAAGAERRADGPAGGAVDEDRAAAARSSSSTSSAVKEPIPNLALSNVVRSSVGGAVEDAGQRAGRRQDSRQPSDARPHRHGPRARARRDPRQGQRRVRRRRAKATYVEDDSARPLRRSRTNSRPRPCFCSPTPRGTLPARRCRSTAVMMPNASTEQYGRPFRTPVRRSDEGFSSQPERHLVRHRRHHAALALRAGGGDAAASSATPSSSTKRSRRSTSARVKPGDIVGVGIHTGNALRGYEVGRPRARPARP